MDSIVIKNVKILDKKSPYHNKVVDVQIEKGIYKKIGKNLSHKNEINGKGCILSHGFTDLRAFVQDPGEEFKEDYKSMEKVALAGGFTEICVHPFDEHSLQKKQDLEYLKSINKKSSVKFTPIAASTVGIKGDEISEMFDMKNSGALGFSNGNQPIAHAGVMNRLLQYASNTNTTLFIHAQLDYLVPNWQASEGVNNLKTGLKGLPNLAESVLVNRDLALADYNETKIHFSHISTAESVKLIKEAKKKGISVTADVSIMHLLFNDEDILEFDSNFKCNPPLRSKKDQEALIKGLKDGVIDAICTDHNAQDTESKKVEFDNALFGTSTAQWTFSKAYEKLVKGLGQERVIELFTSRPCEILGKENNIIKEGETVNFTLFSPKEEWEFNATSNQSKSLNSPFLQSKIRGKIIATGRNKDIYRF